MLLELRLTASAIWEWIAGPTAVYSDEEEEEESEEEESTSSSSSEEEEPARKRIRNMGDTQLIEFVLNHELAQDQVLAKGFGATLTRHHLLCLRNGGLLNDEVINFEMGLLQQRIGARVLVLNTFFYAKLTENGGFRFDLVKNWKHDKLPISPTNFDRILCPIHVSQHNHWVLADINVARKEITLFDSLPHHEEGHGEVVDYNRNILLVLNRWQQEANPHESHQWAMFKCDDCPKQNNGLDCGVFAITFAWELGVNGTLLSDAVDVLGWRRRILLDIIKYEEQV